MKTSIGMIAVGAVLIGLSSSAIAAEEVSVATTPPVVVETMPRAGATDVDPSLGEIRVTFSKDMMTEQMWSWVIHAEGYFPEVTGDVRYVDKRTCVAPVRLEPGRSYAIWFNSPNYKHNAFRDTANNPAVPYLLVFETRK